MAFDAVTDEATLTEAEALHGVLQTRLAELAMMDRAAAQMMALSTAAGNVDLSDLTTQAAVNAASTAIAALEVALAAAVDVGDADKATYQATVDAGKMAVMTAQGVLDHASQTSALASAVMDLNAIDLGNLTTQAAIDAAQAAIDAVQAALDAATELSDAEKAAALAELATATRTVLMAQGRVDVAGQMAALSTAVTALEAIDLDNLMTQEQIDAANEAIVTLELALEAATDLTDAQKLDATVDVTLAKRKVMAAETTLATNVQGQRDALMTAATALRDDRPDRPVGPGQDRRRQDCRGQPQGGAGWGHPPERSRQGHVPVAVRHGLRRRENGADRHGTAVQRMAAQRIRELMDCHDRMPGRRSRV